MDKFKRTKLTNNTLNISSQNNDVCFSTNFTNFNSLTLQNLTDKKSPNEDDHLCVWQCGLGYLAPSSIKTDECVSHDECVRVHSHAECLYDPPINQETGEQFSSLIEAAFSWAVALFGGIGSVTVSADGYNDVYFFGDSQYYTPAAGGFCTFDINCIDNPLTQFQ